MTSSKPSAGRKHRKPGRPPQGSEDKRERILTEAVALFGARGYAGTSLADIASAAEISKAGLLHHFSSKEQLFAQVLTRRDQDTSSLFDLDDVDDPWAMMDGYLRLIEYNTHQRDLVSIYTATAVSVLDAEHPAHPWLAEHLSNTVAMFEAALERGKEKGTVHPDAPSALMARTLTAISDGMQLQWLCATTPNTAADPCLTTTMVDEARLIIECFKDRWKIG